MSTSNDAGYSGRLRSSTRPNQEAQETGRERSRSRPDSRSGSRTREREDLRTRAPATIPRATPGGTARAHQPTGSTRRFARRKQNNLRQAWGPLGASSHQPGERLPLASPCSTEHHRRRPDTPPRQSTTARTPGIGASMPTRTRYRRWSEPSTRTKPLKQQYSGVRHVNIAMCRKSSWRRTLRGRHLRYWRGCNESSPFRLRPLRRELLEEHHYAEVVAVNASLKTDDPPV